jgi:excinuclease ABC subunit C
MTRSIPDWLAHMLDTAPRRPGCYLMKNRLDEVVYIGKAQDLRARLHQYFQPGTSDTRFFVGLLDKVLGAIDIIVSNSAKEALLLENELIKRHQPRFNVKLKDDKNFLNIRIGAEHPFPRLQVVRRRKKDGAEYFGPFHSATAIRQTLKVVNRYFQLRTCRDNDFASRTRPCLQHQIGRCPAPCVLPVDPESYRAHVDDVKLFLGGRGDRLVATLKAQMFAASERFEFEMAARIRDQIAAIERSLAPQKVVLSEIVDIDVIGLFREAENGVIAVLHLRGGVLVGSHPYPFRKSLLPDDALIDGFLSAWFDGSRPVPDLVLTPVAVPDAEAWSELLSETRGRRVEVREPQRGDKRRLIELANENAQAAFAQRRRNEADAEEVLQRLQQQLHLQKIPKRIECYDISNIQGTDQVASMVVAVDGVLAPKEYRHYRIRRAETPDDFASMLEVLSRRFRRIAEGAVAPDLIVVDGGRGQLSMAVEALRAIGVEGVELAGLAKSRVLDEDGHVRKGRAKRRPDAAPSSDDVERSPERVFRPMAKNPIVLRANSNELFLLQQLRDEAHRFAITHHRKLRSKRTLRSALDDIPGIGPARRKALLTHFGSLQRVREVEEAAIAAVPGFSAALAARIKEALRENG